MCQSLSLDNKYSDARQSSETLTTTITNSKKMMKIVVHEEQ